MYRLTVTKTGREMWYKDGRLVSAESVPEEEKKKARDKSTEEKDDLSTQLGKDFPDFRWSVSEGDGMYKVRAYRKVMKRMKNGPDREVEEQFMARAVPKGVLNYNSIKEKVTYLVDRLKAKELAKKYGFKK